MKIIALFRVLQVTASFDKTNQMKGQYSVGLLSGQPLACFIR